MAELSWIESRHQMIRHFDGYSVEQFDAAEGHRKKGPPVKTHLLEVVDHADHGGSAEFTSVFSRHGLQLRQLDDQLFHLTDPVVGDIGFLERLRPRIVALYSTNKSEALGP